MEHPRSYYMATLPKRLLYDVHCTCKLPSALCINNNFTGSRASFCASFEWLICIRRAENGYRMDSQRTPCYNNVLANKDRYHLNTQPSIEHNINYI